MAKPVKKEIKRSYFEVLEEWNSGSEDSFKCPEEFKKKFQKATKTDVEEDYSKRRRTKMEETKDV